MEKQEERKNKVLNIILISAIVGMIVILAGYAWAKYSKSHEGNAASQVAKWSFKLTGGDIVEGETVNFADTREDGDENIATGTIAPGTRGKFEIGIDARGTETNLIYEVKMDFTMKPKNLKIYLGNEEINVENNKYSYRRFLTYEQAKEIQTQAFSWNWPFETGSTENEKYMNNLDDTAYINQQMLMQISIVGIQADTGGANITYNGNGATSGGMAGSVVLEGSSEKLSSNSYRRTYDVNLDANGGTVENSKLVSEYEFSHWSTDNTNENVLFFSTEEKNGYTCPVGEKEFTQYVDIAPYVDRFGLGVYNIAFDLKSEDTSRYNIMRVYCQNGERAKYYIGVPELVVTTEYQHYNMNKQVQSATLTENRSMLAFYGVYGYGNVPYVKNLRFDLGEGYESGELISYDKTSNSQLNLYAKWIPKAVTLPTPTKEGATFSGWYTEKEGGTMVDTTYTPTENVTLYAHWE